MQFVTQPMKFPLLYIPKASVLLSILFYCTMEPDKQYNEIPNKALNQ